MDINNKYSNVFIKNELVSDMHVFYIDGVKFTLELGMTWEQWINSKYNDSCVLFDSNIKCFSKYISTSVNSELLSKDALIVENNYYVLVSSGAGKVCNNNKY